MSLFGVFLVCIYPYSDWIRIDTPYLSVLSPNAEKHGPEKLQIRTLFTQWSILLCIRRNRQAITHIFWHSSHIRIYTDQIKSHVLEHFTQRYFRKTSWMDTFTVKDNFSMTRNLLAQCKFYSKFLARNILLGLKTLQIVTFALKVSAFLITVDANTI